MIQVVPQFAFQIKLKQIKPFVLNAINTLPHHLRIILWDSHQAGVQSRGDMSWVAEELIWHLVFDGKKHDKRANGT